MTALFGFTWAVLTVAACAVALTTRRRVLVRIKERVARKKEP